MIDDSKITEAVDAYIGYPKEIDEGIETSMRRDAFEDWESYCNNNQIAKWCYLKDILPSSNDSTRLNEA